MDKNEENSIYINKLSLLKKILVEKYYNYLINDN